MLSKQKYAIIISNTVNNSIIFFRTFSLRVQWQSLKYIYFLLLLFIWAHVETRNKYWNWLIYWKLYSAQKFWYSMTLPLSCFNSYLLPLTSKKIVLLKIYMIIALFMKISNHISLMFIMIQFSLSNLSIHS